MVRFPFTNGSEFKRRPALIISNERIDKTEDFLLVQITSKFKNDNLSINIEDNDCTQPLPLKSFIRPHKIFTVHKSLIIMKINEVKSGYLKMISDNIYDLIKVE